MIEENRLQPCLQIREVIYADVCKRRGKYRLQKYQPIFIWLPKIPLISSRWLLILINTCLNWIIDQIEQSPCLFYYRKIYEVPLCARKSSKEVNILSRAISGRKRYARFGKTPMLSATTVVLLPSCWQGSVQAVTKVLFVPVVVVAITIFYMGSSMKHRSV